VPFHQRGEFVVTGDHKLTALMRHGLNAAGGKPGPASRARIAGLVWLV